MTIEEAATFRGDHRMLVGKEGERVSVNEEQIEQAKMLSGLRNALQQAVETVDAYLNWLGQRQGMRDTEKPKRASIGENVFTTLKWEAGKGSRLGDFEVAYKAQNMPEPWHHGYNILKANNATINNRFHPEGYIHSYWIYPDKYNDRIFRKKREERRDGGSSRV